MIRIAIAALLLGLVLSQALFILSETEQALVLQFGEPKRVVTEPGLYAKLPFVQNVVRYDVRVLDLDVPAEEVIAGDQKRLVVDTYLRFRIVDPLKFYQAVRREEIVRARLGELVSASLRRVVGNVALADLLSKERADVMVTVHEEVDQESDKFGLDVVDVRIRRADLPEANSQAIYDRMKSEREREAKEFRAQGAEQAQSIRARAERERTVILAEAQKKSQILRGEGDSKSIRIYADAFGKDPEFFAFYRSMEAYRKALGEGDTTLVLSPEGEFFRFFQDLEGRERR